MRRMLYRQITYGKVIGSISDITIYSFYVTKTTATATATGEGGMVTTENKDYLSRIKTMRLHGMALIVMYSTVILPINLHGSMK